MSRVGKFDRPSRIEQRPVGHRPDDVIVGDEVDSFAVWSPADRIDSGDHRQLAGAGVMRTGRAAAYARMQADGEDVDELLADGGLRDLELLVMRRLVKGRHHCRIHESSISGLVERAERRGLVARAPSPADGRVVLVSLTDDGRSLVAEAASQFGADVLALLNRLSESDRRALSRLVSRLLVAHAADHGIDLFPGIDAE